jgi:hypothetical protein
MAEPTEICFALRGRNYRLQLSVRQLTSFAISLFDEDRLDRWVGQFTASFIREITRCAGSPRSASCFWQMLRTAVAGTSRELTFDVLSATDLAHFPGSTNMYVILCYATAFDQIRYPLVLHKKPYQPAEWQVIARRLKAENHRLQNAREADLTRQLESRLCTLTATTKRMADDRERAIRKLKGRVARLEAEHKRSLCLVRCSDHSESSSSTGSSTEDPCYRPPRIRLGELDTDWRRIRALINERYRY